MKLTVNRNTLTTALQRVQGSTGESEADVSMGFANVRLEVTPEGRLELCTMSLEAASKIQLDAIRVDGAGLPCAVNAKRLLDAARLMRGGSDMDLTITENALTIRSGKGTARLPLFDKPDTLLSPWKLDMPDTAAFLTVDNPAALKAAIGAAWNVGKDCTNVAMAGLCMEVVYREHPGQSEVSIVSTTGMKLCAITLPVTVDGSIRFIAQPRSVDVLLEALAGISGSLTMEVDSAVLKLGKDGYAARIQGSAASDYVKWRPMVDGLKTDLQVKVARQDVLDVLRRVAAIAGPKSGARISLSDQGLSITSEETEHGATDGLIDATLVSGVMSETRLVHPKFLIDLLESVDENADTIDLGMSSIDGRPMIVEVLSPGRKESRFMTILTR